MNINKLNEIYEKNKYLDNLFQTKYKDVLDYRKRNYIGFLVELGEFVNETKCFKYWTIKQPNMELVLDEYADCITGVLTFFNELNLELTSDYPHIRTNDTLEVINAIFSQASNLMTNINEKLLRTILSNILYLGELLDFKEDEILSAIEKKQKVVEERLNSEY